MSSSCLVFLQRTEEQLKQLGSELKQEYQLKHSPETTVTQRLFITSVSKCCITQKRTVATARDIAGSTTRGLLVALQRSPVKRARPQKRARSEGGQVAKVARATPTRSAPRPPRARTEISSRFTSRKVSQSAAAALRVYAAYMLANF